VAVVIRTFLFSPLAARTTPAGFAILRGSGLTKLKAAWLLS
jgi:hypothetical protein